jgi:hypothetical protein
MHITLYVLYISNLSISVCISSAIRIVAVINFVTTDPTYSQVYAYSWTYMEMGIAVISGNLPLLRPLFKSFFRMTNQTLFASKGRIMPTQHGLASGAGSQSYIASVKRSKGFERMSEEIPQGSDIEMGDRAILVETDFRVTSDCRNDYGRKIAEW